MSAPVLPTSLVDNPRLDRWIHFNPDRTVRIATGKVEIGQGVVTALGQIAADELDVPLERVAVLSGDTDHGPDEMYTTSSLSIEMSGGSIRLVCAEVRAKALDRAALRLNCSPDDLSVVDGAVPAERRGDGPGLLDASRRDRSVPAGDRQCAAEEGRMPTRSSAARCRGSICRRR